MHKGVKMCNSSYKLKSVVL